MNTDMSEKRRGSRTEPCATQAFESQWSGAGGAKDAEKEKLER